MRVWHNASMKLSLYLEKTGLSVSAFAARIGVDHSSVSRYARDERIPGRDVMQRIRAETGGAVTADDFYASSGNPPADDAGEAAA